MPYCHYPNKCPLGTCVNIRTHGMDPWGAERPLLYIVGEAPGNMEDQQGIPFVGPAGKLLHDMLRRMQVDINRVVHTGGIRVRQDKEARGAFFHGDDNADSLVKPARISLRQLR